MERGENEVHDTGEEVVDTKRRVGATGGTLRRPSRLKGVAGGSADSGPVLLAQEER